MFSRAFLFGCLSQIISKGEIICSNNIPNRVCFLIYLTVFIHDGGDDDDDDDDDDGSGGGDGDGDDDDDDGDGGDGGDGGGDDDDDDRDDDGYLILQAFVTLNPNLGFLYGMFISASVLILGVSSNDHRNRFRLFFHQNILKKLKVRVGSHP